MNGLALLLKDLTLKMCTRWPAEDYLHSKDAMRNTLATESRLKGGKRNKHFSRILNRI